MLKALERAGGNVSAACKAAGVHKNLFYRLRKEDKDFASRVAAIKDKAARNNGRREALRESGMWQRVIDRRSALTELLKGQGKYTAELSVQVDVLAQLLVRAEDLACEIFSDQHKAVNVELSREGNPRETISPLETLYLNYMAHIQRVLRSLGMNTDSKERKTDNDAFGEFMNSFKEGMDNE